MKLHTGWFLELLKANNIKTLTEASKLLNCNLATLVSWNTLHRTKSPSLLSWKIPAYIRSLQYSKGSPAWRCASCSRVLISKQLAKHPAYCPSCHSREFDEVRVCELATQVTLEK